jgi:hypothetical protein
MRRAIASIEGQPFELRLRNISSMGALVESDASVAPGAELTIDIVGVGPVRGLVRWAQSGKFGVQFEREFDLTRLAPKQERRGEPAVVNSWYTKKREAS